jgi:hypothetical protein
MASTPYDRRMVCVLGMHRSGTSAVTRILHDLGVYLGPPHHHMKPRGDNPIGFFEHQPLTDLNDQIVWDLRGTWFSPPVLSEGWVDAPILLSTREKAVMLLEEDFGTSAVWAWKDPRTSLTFPFWQPLLPPVRCVLCLRNPLDVARSLQVRDGFALEAGISLWMEYVAAAVRHTRGVPVLLVSYDDVLDRADETVDRLVAFAALRPSRDARDAAVAHASSNPGLRHHRATLDELCRSGAASMPAVALHLLLQSRLEAQRARWALGARPDAESNRAGWSSDEPDWR